MANRARAFWLAGFAGAALPFALAPFGLWPLAFVSVAVLFRVLDEVKPSRAMVLGWAFGVGKYGVGASWIYVSIHDYGPAPVWLAASLVAVFVGAMAWFPAAFTFVYARWVRGPNRLVNAIGFSACWVALEWILTWFLTGFPWLFLGYAQLDNPLRHWAPVGGVLSVSLVAALSATIAVSAIARHATRRSVTIAVLAAAVPWIAVNWSSAARKPITATNLAKSLKHIIARDFFMSVLFKISCGAGPPTGLPPPTRPPLWPN